MKRWTMDKKDTLAEALALKAMMKEKDAEMAAVKRELAQKNDSIKVYSCCH